jgi:hypothetical protein
MAYLKLTRKKRTLLGSTQLWLGDGHILMVRSTRFVEEYRRFSLSDIQAVVASEQNPRLAMQVILVVASALAFFAMLNADSVGGRIFASLTGLALLAVFVYDFVRGQRCNCRLLTEVSSEPIDPVTRTSDYKRLLSALLPALEGVQGALPLDGREEMLSGLSIRAAFVRPEERGPDGVSRYLPHTFFAILLANAMLIAALYFWRREDAFAAAGSAFIGELALSILMLVRSKRFGIEGTIRTLVGATCALLVVDLISVVSQAGYLIYSIAEAGRTGGTPPKFWDLPWVLTAGKFDAGWRVLASITGFVLLWMMRAPRRRAEEPPPSQP